jgi:hypothetical protein
MEYSAEDRKAVYMNDYCRQVFQQPANLHNSTMKSIRFTVQNYHIDVAGFPEAKLVGILSYLISTGVFRSAAAVVREFTDLDDLEIARLHDPTKPSTEHQPPHEIPLDMAT